jgi:hypothetical protein
MKLLIPILSVSILMVGCTTYQTAPTIKQPIKVVKDINTTKTYVAPKPKKNIELKEVEDTNFSSEYMYPETKTQKKKSIVNTQKNPIEVTTNTMDKKECISMIGQEKFNKYTQMLGNEASAIRKCQMLKAM